MSEEQRSVRSLSDGLSYVRLTALGTMFFLGATAGRSAPVPWWVWFTLATCCGIVMMLLFFDWAHKEETKGAKEPDDGGA